MLRVFLERKIKEKTNTYPRPVSAGSPESSTGAGKEQALNDNTKYDSFLIWQAVVRVYVCQALYIC